MHRGWPCIGLWAAAVVVHALVVTASVKLGGLNQDEGWYLYAADRVADGQRLYADFLFTQAPMLPHVYALAGPLFRRWGLEGGRWFTAGLAAAAALLVALAAARLAARESKATAAFCAYVLCAINVYQGYYTAIPKTYALCGLFLAAGFFSLSFLDGRRGALAAGLAGAFLGLAAATRISAGFALAGVGLVLLLCRRRIDGRAWLAFGVGGAAVLAVVYLLYVRPDPRAFWFSVVEYNAAREPGSLLSSLVFKAGFVSRLVQAYFVAACALAAASVWLAFRPRGSHPTPALSPAEAAGWAGVALVSVVHFFAPFPYDDYQTFLYPVFAGLLALLLVRCAPSPETRTRLAVLLLLCCTAGAFSSPLNQDWFVLRQDRIWLRMKQETPLEGLRRAAAIVLRHARPGEELLSQDVYLALEAGMTVPRGFEFGPFSYFRDLDSETARRFHVVNREMMTSLLGTSTAPVAAFSGYGLAIRAPQVDELPAEEQEALRGIVESRYRTVAELADFGQAHTPLRIYVRAE